MKISIQFKQPDIGRKYRKMKSDLDREIRQAIAEVTTHTSLQAKQAAPVDKGNLRTSIHKEVIQGGLTGRIIVNAHYGPYREFGTGDKVQIPTGYEEYARQFKRARIRKVNSRAQPYLIPAFERNKMKFIKDCDRRLNKVI